MKCKGVIYHCGRLRRNGSLLAFSALEEADGARGKTRAVKAGHALRCRSGKTGEAALRRGSGPERPLWAECVAPLATVPPWRDPYTGGLSAPFS